VDLYLVTETDFRRLLAAIDLGMEAPEPVALLVEDVDPAATAVADAADSRSLQLFESILLDAMGERAHTSEVLRGGSRRHATLRERGLHLQTRVLPQRHLVGHGVPVPHRWRGEEVGVSRRKPCVNKL
jgi:hypothetical protein